MTTPAFIAVEDDNTHALEICHAAEQLISSRQATTIAIIGGGLGGLSAAIALASEGFHVELFEKNNSLGGKVNSLQTKGYSFDLGPSLLTQPQVFETLFSRVGKRMSDYVQLEPEEPLRRNFFSDGSILDLTDDQAFNQQQLETISHSAAKEFGSFIRFAQTLQKAKAFQKSDNVFRLLTVRQTLKKHKRKRVDHEMQLALRQFVHNRKVLNVLSHGLYYREHQPIDAQSLLNPLPTTLEQQSLWRIKSGGVYAIVNAMKRLAMELGVTIHLNNEVTDIISQPARIASLRLKNGESFNPDIVISNMELEVMQSQLLHQAPKPIKKISSNPTGSAIVLHLGLRCRYPQLKRHNFFYPNKKSLLNLALSNNRVIADPTLYLHTASVSDSEHAPAGCQAVSVLLHLPVIDPQQPLSPNDYQVLRNFIIEQLEAMGLTELRQQIAIEHYWTPHDFQRAYYATQGAIFGADSRPPVLTEAMSQLRSIDYHNLYFVGGTAALGGGMPMAVLSGQRVRDAILADLGQR